MGGMMQHAWALTENGKVDLSAVHCEAYPYHEGPSCRRCGEYFCVSCETEGDAEALQRLLDEPCVDYWNPNQLDLFDGGV